MQFVGQLDNERSELRDQLNGQDGGADRTMELEALRKVGSIKVSC
jgi:hypothetical protein